MDDTTSAPAGSGAPAPGARLPVLPLALVFGLLAGWAEGLVYMGKRLILDQNIERGYHAFWMAPLAEGVLFLVGGLALLALRRALPSVFGSRVIGFFLIATAGFAVLQTARWLHEGAGLVIAIGLGVQLSRLLARRPPAAARAWRAAAALALPVLLLALGVRWHAGRAEAARATAIGDGGAAGPNVLILLLDTVRKADLSLYGYAPATTPRLEEVARAGVTFEDAITPAPWTLPSHASIFTGRNPLHLSAGWWTPLDGTYPTLAEVLRDRGYMTAGFSANIFPWVTYEFGLNRGMVHWEDYPVNAERALLCASLGRLVERAYRRLGGNQLGRKNAARMNRDFLAWLDGRPDRPFFAFINYFDAHDPYRAPREFATRFWPGVPDGELGVANERSPARARELRAAYDGAIAYLDHQIGALVDSLDRRGLRDSTIIVILSDHGEEFGEHRVFGHGNSVYLRGIQVPLVVLYPAGGVPGGLRVEAPVSTTDVAATILDLAGQPRLLPGASLAWSWSLGGDPEGPRPAMLTVLTPGPGWRKRPDWFPTSGGPMRSLVTDHWHYIRQARGGEELYDLATDTMEADDLSGERALAPVLDSLRGLLADSLDL